jgi:hypothetical protein
VGYLPAGVAPFGIHHGREDGGKESRSLLELVFTESEVEWSPTGFTYEVFEHGAELMELGMQTTVIKN